MAGFTASWVHGTAVVMESPGDLGSYVFEFVHFGWGTQIKVRPGHSGWYHIAIPTPVILDNRRMKLHRVFLQWRQISGYPNCGYIEDAHLWDGQTRVARRSANDFKTSGFATIPGHYTFELREPREWHFGLGLSFKLGAHGNVSGHFVDDREAPTMIVGSAGADFDI